jgi:hypothetical protein
MGADYYIYTEVKRKDNTWHALNGQYYNEANNRYEITETYWSGSRTYFSRTYNKLREIGYPINPFELSSEVIAKEEWVTSEDGDYVTAVSIHNLRSAIPNTIHHQCCGYVHKRNIWNHEAEGEEIEDYICAEDYDELSEAEKKEYEFYEWDDPMDWYVHLKSILKIVEFQISEYMSVNHMWTEPSDIRIVCIVSY